LNHQKKIQPEKQPRKAEGSRGGRAFLAIGLRSSKGSALLATTLWGKGFFRKPFSQGKRKKLSLGLSQYAGGDAKGIAKESFSLLRVKKVVSL
jgi:hypothetical protein